MPAKKRGRPIKGPETENKERNRFSVGLSKNVWDDLNEFRDAKDWSRDRAAAFLIQKALVDARRGNTAAVQSHSRALGDAVAWLADQLEQETRETWRTDRHTFDAVKKVVEFLLEKLKPAGQARPSTALRERYRGRPNPEMWLDPGNIAFAVLSRMWNRGIGGRPPVGYRHMHSDRVANLVDGSVYDGRARDEHFDIPRWMEAWGVPYVDLGATTAPPELSKAAKKKIAATGKRAERQEYADETRSLLKAHADQGHSPAETAAYLNQHEVRRGRNSPWTEAAVKQALRKGRSR